MENIDFKHVERFIESIVEKLKTTLAQDTVDAIQHYLEHGEYELAFEGLFIEIMNMTDVPKIDLMQSRIVAKQLKLDKESVFDFNFWEKFDEYSKRNSSHKDVR